MFRTIMLFVDEKESVERQLKRGREIMEHNKRVLDMHEVEKLLPLRETDVNIEAAQKRYQVFKEQTFESLNSLKEKFPYHFINAQNTISETQKNIMKELQYQSSLELDEETFQLIRHLPTAREVVQNCRQHLVTRLNEYQQFQRDLFIKVIKVIETEFYESIRMHAVSGEALITTYNEVFRNPLAVQMVIDVLTDRSFHVVAEHKYLNIPARLEGDGHIACEKFEKWRFFIRFEKSIPIHHRVGVF
eukprot:GEZU01019479.1.p1 GENE.GEZU01019479.1~~GEZU01019479.1.p1  ORF type:complete len:246 (+),score=70.19 GEZU01019479.1:516-1253(+)